MNDRVQHNPESQAVFLPARVADPRAVAAAYQADPRLKQLISELLQRSETSAELWSTGGAGVHDRPQDDPAP